MLFDIHGDCCEHLFLLLAQPSEVSNRSTGFFRLITIKCRLIKEFRNNFKYFQAEVKFYRQTNNIYHTYVAIINNYCK